jgi:hypothetical protein
MNRPKSQNSNTGHDEQNRKFVRNEAQLIILSFEQLELGNWPKTKKSDATFHILQTSELAFFSKNPPQYPKLPNLRIMLQLAKHVHAKFQLSSYYPDWQQNFCHFFRKISEFSRSEFQNNPNLSI